MAIIIPSKNIYNKENPKIIDNVIDRIEIGAVEIVPNNENDTTVFNKEIKVKETKTNKIEKVDEDFKDGLCIYENAIKLTHSYALAYCTYMDVVQSNFSISFNQVVNNKSISRLKFDVDNEDKNLLNYTLYGYKKTGRASNSYEATITSTGNSTTLTASMGTVNLTEQSASEVEQLIEIPNTIDVTSSVLYHGENGETTSVTANSECNLRGEVTASNDNGIITLNVKNIVVGSKTVETSDVKHNQDNGTTTGEMSGYYTEYEGTRLEISVNGDFIGIDLKDQTLYVNGEKAKKVYSVEGNELMQTTNYTPLYKYENVGDIKFTGQSSQHDKYLSLEITTLLGLELQIGDTFYYKEDSIYVIAETNDGWETIVKYGGAIEKAFKENSSQTITISKKITEEQLNIVPKFKETQKLYEKGKETATVLCSISDYYEYGTLSKKIISIDNSTNKMMFEVGDEVIPMVYSSSGVDVPMSVYNDKEKTFIVVGCRIYYDGAVWQELSLQEYHVIQFNATEGLTYDYSSAFGGYVCTGIGTAKDTDIVIDSTYNGFTIRGIDASAFEGELLTSVRIPDTVIRIGSSAFEGCTSLSIINIGNSVETINIDAFYNTRYYNNENNWENGVVLYIGEYLIKAKTALAGEYTIKNGTLCIADFAFDSLQNIRSVNMPDSLRSIGKSAFEGSDGIGGQIKIPNSVKLIGERAFYGLGDVKSVKMSSSLRYIGADAFYNCVNLIDVHVDSIASWCNIEFENRYANPLCHKAYLFLDGIILSNLIIPRGVQYITKYAFYSSPSFIHVDTGLVSEIDDYAFWGCNSLTSVVLSNVRRIGQNAFYGTSLHKVYYKGLKNDWDESYMGIENGNDKLLDATRYYYSENQPTESGNWWHYVDGVPTIWVI